MRETEHPDVDSLLLGDPGRKLFSAETRGRLLAELARRTDDPDRARRLLDAARELVPRVRDPEPLLFDLLEASVRHGDVERAREIVRELQWFETPWKEERGLLSRLSAEGPHDLRVLEEILKIYYRGGWLEEAAPLHEEWSRKVSGRGCWSASIRQRLWEYSCRAEPGLSRLRQAAREGRPAGDEGEREVPRMDPAEVRRLLDELVRRAAAGELDGDRVTLRVGPVPDDLSGARTLARLAVAARREEDAELAFAATRRLREMLARREGAERVELLQVVTEGLLDEDGGLLAPRGASGPIPPLATGPIARRLLEFVAAEAAGTVRRTEDELVPPQTSFHLLLARVHEILGREEEARRIREETLAPREGYPLLEEMLEIAPGIPREWLEEQLEENPSLDDLAERLEYQGPFSSDFEELVGWAEEAAEHGHHDIATVFANQACEMVDVLNFSLMDGEDPGSLLSDRDHFQRILDQVSPYATNTDHIEAALEEVETLISEMGLDDDEEEEEETRVDAAEGGADSP